MIVMQLVLKQTEITVHQHVFVVTDQCFIMAFSKYMALHNLSIDEIVCVSYVSLLEYYVCRFQRHKR